MNIIIPIGGKGERFFKEGYSLPKPLIFYRGKRVIQWLLDCLKLEESDRVYVSYTSTLDKYNFKEIFSFKGINLIRIPYQTNSVIETLKYTILYIEQSRLDYPTVSFDCDTFYEDDILRVCRESPSNCILYKKDYNKKEIYSYLSLDNNDRVVSIAEKKKISDNANIGVYKFKTTYLLSNLINVISQRNIKEELYISYLYSILIKEDIVYGKNYEKSTCIGTPHQMIIQSYNSQNTSDCRVCFDLDDTLVTKPQIKDDYSSVLPIEKNISFLQYLKKCGCYIIIYTSRRMKTHSSNLGKIMADISAATINTLQKFNIPYDEIYFGKPYADFYIDDKAISSFNDLERETGFYNISIKERSFNSLTYHENYIEKTSIDKKILGEIHWYENIIPSISHLFPKMLAKSIIGNVISYRIERIRGIPLSYYYINNCLSNDIFKNLISTIDKIHYSSSCCDYTLLYNLYSSKLKQRFCCVAYSKFNHSKKIYDFLCEKYRDYEFKNLALPGIFHGDTVLSNILLDHTNSLKFIDMRGIIGSKVTIYGDTMYDYAKILQSLYGYEHILNDRTIDISYRDLMIEEYKTIFVSKFSLERWKFLQYLSLGLIFTLIPLHDEKYREKFYFLCIDVLNMIEK